MCILSAYALLKVVGYYDLSVLPMSVMGYQKKIGWRVGGVSSSQFFLDFWNFVNFAKPLNPYSSKCFTIKRYDIASLN